MEENKILLIDENGQEVEFIIDDQFNFEDKVYLVLCENEESDDALLFRIDEDENNEMVLNEVEDEDEFNRVNEFYLKNIVE